MVALINYFIELSTDILLGRLGLLIGIFINISGYFITNPLYNKMFWRQE